MSPSAFRRCDPIIAFNEDSNVRRGAVLGSQLREAGEDFSAFVNGGNSSVGCVWIVESDVVVDLLKPASSFNGPRYFRHDSMTRFISL